MKFTTVTKSSGGIHRICPELPGANTQGKTLEETKVNLQEAIEMTLEADHIFAEESIIQELSSSLYERSRNFYIGKRK